MSEARDLNKRFVFMNIAKTLGNLGTCDRKKVGAVIIRDGRCISWGFNGAPAGLPHCSENDHGYRHPGPFGFGEELILDPDAEPGTVLWKEDDPEYISRIVTKHGCRNATHAEANTLAAAAKQGISTDGAELFVGVSPCETCARLIIAAGIVRVYFAEEYRKDDGCRLLQMASIESLLLS